MCNNSSFGYTDSREFLLTTSHFLTIFAIPLNIFMGYCIYKKTPKRYKTAKWYLLHLHCWTTLTDLILGAFIIPYMFFPVFAGIATGIFTLLGMPVTLQVFCAQVALGGLATSIVMIFENRHHILVRGKYKFANNWLRYTFYVLNGVYSVFFLLPLYFQVPEAHLAKTFLENRLPCPHPDYYLESVYVFTTDSANLVKTAGIYLIFVVSEAVFMCVHSSFHLFQFDIQISANTRKLQRKLFLDMLLQVSVPVFVMVIPMSYCLISSMAVHYNQTLNNISIILMTSHGISSTITIFLTNPTYRSYFLHVVFRIPEKPTSTFPVSHRSTTATNITHQRF